MIDLAALAGSEVKDESGTVVAEVQKQVHVRRKDRPATLQPSEPLATGAQSP